MNDGSQGNDTSTLRARFEHAVEVLPPATANRLRLARRAALAGEREARSHAAWVVPLAAAAVLVLGVAWWRQAPTPAPVASIASSAEARSVTAPVDAGAIPALADAPGEEEAELYAWIADTPVARDAQDGAL